MSLQIANKPIGEGQSVFVIAEVGINHSGDMTKAKALIDEAAKAGADAVKIQTYLTEKRVAKDSPIFGILKQCELSFNQQRELFVYAKTKNILLFSTPFDSDSVAFLEEMNVPCYKVASFDLVNSVLLKEVASKKRPVILSRGMADQKEIDTAVDILKSAGAPFALLHCISAYPVPQASDLHLATIRALKERYDCPVGYSDHAQGIQPSVLSVAAGAVIIEKHFMLAGDADAPDKPVSLEPAVFAEMVRGIREATKMMGNAVWAPTEAEAGILQFRRPS